MSTSPKGSSLLTPDERRILQQACRDQGVPPDLVEQMILAENKVYGMGRRHGIWESLKALVDEGVARSEKEAP